MAEPGGAGTGRAEERRPRFPRIIEAGGWTGALREFAIIVAGVLCALGAQAWWDGHQERGRERDYLRQLLADTRENEARLNAAIANDSASGKAASRLVDALTRTDAPPSAETFLEWMMGASSASDFRAVAGNYRAILGTGELRLVRNDTLRALLAAYSSSLDTEADRQRLFRETITELAMPMARSLPFMRRALVGDIRPQDVDVAAMRRNPDAAAVLFSVHAAYNNRVSGMRTLRNDTRRLRSALEAEPSLRSR
ncbi:MAG TPA: hypothetical protein VF710_18165 [Longimicrobium sp.]